MLRALKPLLLFPNLSSNPQLLWARSMLQGYKPMYNECRQGELIQMFLCANLPRLRQKTNNFDDT